MRIHLFKSIISLFMLLCLSTSLASADEFSNTEFFILSDRSFSSQEQAQVRLEMQDVQAVHNNAGMEIAVYKVPHPIAFLQKQSNLHRINTKAQAAKPGVWNAIVAMWDYVAQTARNLARKFFSEDARRTTVNVAPDLHTLNTPHNFTHQSAYKPLEGFDMVSRFRYPLQFAKEIKSAQAILDGANVEGSISFGGASFNTNEEQNSESTESQAFSNGNVYIPIGKLEPGLYIVEAMLGEQRAVTMVFVGDTVAVTKTTASGLFVWTVNRTTGEPVAKVESHWSDGVGELASGETNAEGWLQLNHEAPEQTYLFAQDSKGGVLISENYFYNSEIYNAKVYATTDKPLYRPGDMVNIKVVGREFTNARDSKPLSDAPMQVTVFDPNGLPVANQTLQFTGAAGGDTAFQLPALSVAGGYEIHLSYLGEVYSAAFRVAQFQKPHFQINLNVDNDDLKTGSKIPVALQLRYPDGKPVKNADVEIDLKAQAISMVDGDLAYSGQFPIKLTSQSYKTDSSGNVSIDLPEAKEPSRYIVSALATDSAAYRVRHTQELLIERGMSNWYLKTASRFTAPKKAVHFELSRAASNATNLNDKASKPSQWKWVRLEDQTQAQGYITGDTNKGIEVLFEKSGSYTVSLMSEDGKVLGATSHWISGPELKVPVGHIEVVWDKSGYQVGEVASALISFSEPIEHALLTLERDSIEKTSLLKVPNTWLKTYKIGPQQWRVNVPVTETFAPNLTLSVAYVKNNEFVFENAGILVTNPKINIRVTADKKQYLPGDTVKLAIDTSVISPDGKASNQAISALVSLSVVDEMIYVLQPEIAPNIYDFFYHPRRNNVRTQYSLSFIGYDVSTNQLGKTPKTHQAQERATKVLERPRRDEVDTALWAPKIITDANGHAEVSFKMPDALTRWRITARAMSSNGTVGQNVSDILSNKDFYIKWTSPNWLRNKDSATGNIAIFNQTPKEQKVNLSLQGALVKNEAVTLKPGINFVDIARTGTQSGVLTLTLTQNSKVYDSLNVNLNSMPDHWLTHYSKLITPQEGKLALELPADASNISMRLLDNSRAAFYHVVDDLIEHPYGCVEQTSSRLIPLALAYKALPEDDPRRTSMMRQLYSHRMRLASMAGPDAHFGWWGVDMTVDPFVTTYAYYADWRTAQALKLNLPAEHWERLFKLYSESGFKQPVWQRALMLDWMTQMGLATDSAIAGLAADLVREEPNKLEALKYGRHDSWVLSDESRQTYDLAVVLTSKLLKSNVEGFKEIVTASVDNVAMQESLVAKALLHATGHQKADVDILLSLASSEHATIDRSLMLSWLDSSLSKESKPADKVTLSKPWLIKPSSTGQTVYLWPNANSAKPNAQPIISNSSAVLSYDSLAAPTKNTLPATLERTLYLLEKQSDGSFETSVMNEGDAVTTDALYLESITLTPSISAPTQALRYIVVEAAIPAGAQVESSTWGVNIKDVGELAKANFQDLQGRYAVPLGDVSKAVTVQHLMRFSQRGSYVLPAARAYNMYSPDAQVLEAQPRKNIKVK